MDIYEYSLILINTEWILIQCNSSWNFSSTEHKLVFVIEFSKNERNPKLI